MAFDGAAARGEHAHQLPVLAGWLRLETCNLNVVTGGYPELAPPPGGVPMVVDGEIVALDARGVPRFELLQRRLHVTGTRRVAAAAADTPVVFEVFDLLWLDGRDLMSETYETRRELLAGLKFGTGPTDLREYYSMIAEFFAMRERLEEPNEEFLTDLANMFAVTRKYFPVDEGEERGR